ncbi:hypothetical protein LGK95_19100 [Clostridium algoriphilum]|uniref:hypothetical protein n=1 Tax=Clostridium algoriphilum TaxID=198347 RepID=UPI001CF21543|nr:hypothetical protein [Clostridium algoriphilum]MCB2295590.1 hypothetical protein [Clostridium algoriphilum]
MIIGPLKYEIKWSYERVIAAFLVYILISSVTMSFFKNYKIINTSSFIFVIIFLSIIIFIKIFRRYSTNIYGSEGYLMFTSSSGGKNVLASKLIPALIWMFALTLIMVSLITLLIFSFSELSYSIDFQNFYVINKAYTITYVIEYLLNVFRSVLVMYFSISISKLPIWKGFNILAGLGTYFTIEILNSLPLLILKDMAKYAKTTSGFYVLVKDYSMNNLFVWYIMDVTIFVFLFYATSYLLKNRTNLK